MLDHFGNMTEINPPSPQEFEMRVRQQAREQAHRELKEILERKNSQAGKTQPRRSLLERIARWFGRSRQS